MEEAAPCRERKRDSLRLSCVNQKAVNVVLNMVLGVRQIQVLSMDPDSYLSPNSTVVKHTQQKQPKSIQVQTHLESSSRIRVGQTTQCNPQRLKAGSMSRSNKRSFMKLRTAVLIPLSVIVMAVSALILALYSTKYAG